MPLSPNWKDPGIMYPPAGLGLKLRSYADLVWVVAKYMLHRIHLAPCPDLRLPRRQEHISAVMCSTFDFPHKLRIRGAEHCPKQHPILFAANHFLYDDPLCMYPAIMAVSPNIRTYIMMRDDFFEGFPGWLKRLIDFNEFMISMGAMQISRDNVTFGQLKPLVTLLRKPDTFLIYPGRSRSRNGAFFEYRDDVQELGSVGFFLAHAQSGHPELQIPAVPMARAFNPATKCSTIVFGPPHYLEMEGTRSPDRARQRAFDFALFQAMADLVEVNAAHLVATMFYLNALHGCSNSLEMSVLQENVRKIAEILQNRYVDPALTTQPDAEVEQVVTYLGEKGIVTRSGGSIILDHKAILTVPSAEVSYRRANPIRYLTNQILHLPDVTGLVETFVLKN